MYKSFALSSLSLAAVTAWALIDDHQTEWRAHQQDYAARVVEQAAASNGAVATDVELKLRQVFLPELGVADRCESCHLGAENPTMASAPEPLRVHPGAMLALHPVERFGCTPCHGGDGRGTSFESASHVPGPNSVEPMLSPVMRESRCGTCHRGVEINGAPHLSSGRRQLADRGCAACHTIPGIVQAVPFGPSLDAVGTKLRDDDLAAWIADPHAVRADARMPRFPLSKAETEQLTAFLATQRVTLPPRGDPVNEGDPDAGRSLFGTTRCTTCHQFKGKGGTVGPALDRIGERLSPEWLMAWLANPQSLSPSTLMPQFGLTDQQVLDLAAYLLEEMVGDDAPTDLPRHPRGMSASDRRDPIIDAGQAVFEDRGCYACHDLKRAARAGAAPKREFAPPLDAFGSRAMERLGFVDFPETVQRTLADWTFTKLMTPWITGPTARMPDMRLPPEAAADLTVALLSYRSRPVPPAFVREPPPTTGFRVQGEIGALFSKYRCMSCHTIGGQGGTIANVPLDREGSKVPEAWLAAFLLQPDTLRVAQEARMPKLGMTDDEAKRLATFLTLTMRDDRIPLEAPGAGVAGSVGPAVSAADSVARGLQVFDALGCRGCHTAGGKGGYVGPDLFRSGVRLRSGWVYALLTDPGLMRPEVEHPGEPLDPATARDVTAYVMTLVPEVKAP
jgi:sulfur oxidation c-type cytochrome SoxX